MFLGAGSPSDYHIFGVLAVTQEGRENLSRSAGSWLAGVLARKPRVVVAIALANKTARSVGAMLTKRENYRDSVAAAA
jgi:hypothetical protein